MGGKNNKQKLLFVWIISVVLLAVTMLVVYLIDVRRALNQLGVQGSALEWLGLLMREDADVRSTVLIDTIVSLLFIVVGNIYVTMRILRTQKLESKTLVKFDAPAAQPVQAQSVAPIADTAATQSDAVAPTPDENSEQQ